MYIKISTESSFEAPELKLRSSMQGVKPIFSGLDGSLK